VGATRVAEFLMRTQSLKTLYLTGNHTIGLAGTAALGRALKCNVSLVEYQGPGGRLEPLEARRVFREANPAIWTPFIDAAAASASATMSPMAARRLAAEDERRLDDDEDDDEAYRQRTPRKLHMPDLESNAGKSSIAPGADAAAEEVSSAAVAQLQAENQQLKTSLLQLEAARAADTDKAAGVLSLVVAERDRLRAAAADASALTQQVRDLTALVKQRATERAAVDVTLADLAAEHDALKIKLAAAVNQAAQAVKRTAEVEAKAAQTLGIANSRTVERDASVVEVARLNALLAAAQNDADRVGAEARSAAAAAATALAAKDAALSTSAAALADIKSQLESSQGKLATAVAQGDEARESAMANAKRAADADALAARANAQMAEANKQIAEANAQMAQAKTEIERANAQAEQASARAAAADASIADAARRVSEADARVAAAVQQATDSGTRAVLALKTRNKNCFEYLPCILFTVFQRGQICEKIVIFKYFSLVECRACPPFL
jgi:hypothetical protein